MKKWFSDNKLCKIQIQSACTRNLLHRVHQVRMEKMARIQKSILTSCHITFIIFSPFSWRKVRYFINCYLLIQPKPFFFLIYLEMLWVGTFTLDHVHPHVLDL